MKANLLLAALFGFMLNQPSWAQTAPQAGSGSYNIRKDHLQKAEFYMARIRVDILDESPIVNDRRTAKQNTVYEIQVGPPPVGSTNTTVIPLGAPARAGITSGAPGSAIVRLAASGSTGRLLAPPGFESNMRSLKSSAGALSPAVTTGVHARLTPPDHTGSAVAHNPVATTRHAEATGPQKVVSYPDTYQGGGSSTKANRVSTGVHAVLKRGSLIRSR